MSRKIELPNLDDLIKRYESGTPITQLANELHTSKNTVLARFSERGVQFRGQRLAVDVDTIVARYVAGESVKHLSVVLGLERSVITRRLLERNIPLRGRSDAERLKWMSIKTDRARVERQCRAAWKAATGRVKTLEEKIRTARTVYTRLLRRGAYEDDLTRLLRQRGNIVRQQWPVDQYNLDLAIHASRVAVELHTSNRSQVRVASFRRYRQEHVLDCGWNIIFVCIRAGVSPDLTRIAEQIIAFAEAARRHPSTGGQYGMIGSDGQPIASRAQDLPRRPRIPGF